MPVTYIIISVLSLFLIEFLYFKLADLFDIIDEPNHRSSHKKITIRGGGIIFPVAAIFSSVYTGNYYFFAAGLLLISLISFIDDIRNTPNLLRFGMHLAATIMLVSELSPELEWHWYILIVVILIGTLNAFNFMDGINGITGGYSLVTIGSLYFVNNYILDFTDNYLLLSVAASLLVFNFFNFRKKARCFAGDVGSIGIAFIVCFLLLQLIIKSGNLLYIGFLLIYGLDAATTMFFRLIRKENVFEAHRTHFYQFLANEKGWPHLIVSGLYMMVQLLINAGIACYIIQAESIDGNSSQPFLFLCISAGIIFITLRYLTEGKIKLVGYRT